MKKLHSTLITATLMLAALTLHAAVITVSNNPASPGQYSNLQSAIAAASNGDILLVSGSGTDYYTTNSNTEITINKKLTIYGAGYAPLKDVPTPSQVAIFHLLAGSSNTVIEGFNISNRIYCDAGVSNILIKRNQISQLIIAGDTWIITDNVIYNNVSINGSNITIKNNLINSGGSLANSSGNSNLVFVNNIVSDYPSFTFYQAQVSNNIFYNKSSVNSNYFYYSNGCTITNNIDFNNNNATPFNIGSNGNTGSGNKLATDPMFVSVVFPSGNQLGIASNLNLQTGSPAKNAGTDGKDIGLYGGGTPAQYPLTGMPPIPQITTMNINNTFVAPGGTLSVQLKAKSNN